MQLHVHRLILDLIKGLSIGADTFFPDCDGRTKFRSMFFIDVRDSITVAMRAMNFILDVYPTFIQ